MNYFGGSSRSSGVRRLQATTFKELVDHCIKVGVQVPYTRKEFNSWDVKTRDERKDGPYICCAAYDYEEGPRNDDNATHVTLVILDIDEGQIARDFFEAPALITELLFPLNFAVWTTAKHTAAHPRIKIVVDVEPAHPSMHKRYVADVLRRLGLPDSFKGSRESRTLSLPQYRPIQFKGEQFSAVISSRTNGVALHPSDILLAEDEEESPERVFACDREDGDDGLGALGLAFLPVAGLTIEDLREPLFSVDPDCDRTIWYQIGMSLRHQATSEPEAAEAYQLFDEWSSGGSKYRGEKDTYTVWKSFRPYAKGRAPITVRTLFKHAMTLGRWENTKVATKLKKTTLEWISECSDGDELMVEGAKRIAAMPFQNDVVEEALVMAWRKKLHELTGNLIDKKTLKREITKSRKRDRAEKDAQREDDNTPPWLMPYCYVATTNTFYDTTCGVEISPAAFDNFHMRELMPKDGGDTPANGRPVLMPTPYALNLIEVPRVYETIYYPKHQGEDRFFKYNNRLYLNIYDKSTLPIPDPDHAEKAMEMLREHLTILIGLPESVALFIDYLATMVQFPGTNIRWSFFIQSGEGAGKGILGKTVAGFMGRRNVRIVSPEVLKSQWNDWAKDTLFIILEEVHLPGERREAVTNSIKQVIADDHVTINKRNTHAQCDVPNFANLVAFSNYKDALHLKDDARRWHVIFSPLQTSEQISRLVESGHFTRLEWLFSEEGASALRYALLTHCISPDFPVDGPAPHTEFRNAVIADSKNSVQVQIEDLISDPDFPAIGQDLIDSASLCQRMPRTDPSRIGHYLTILGYRDTGRTFVNGQRSNIWAHAEHWKNHADAVAVLDKRHKIAEFEI